MRVLKAEMGARGVGGTKNVDFLLGVYDSLFTFAPKCGQPTGDGHTAE